MAPTDFDRHASTLSLTSSSDESSSAIPAGLTAPDGLERSVHQPSGTPAARSSQFAALKLAAPLLRALAEEGYDSPTPIQQAAIPPVLQGRDLLGCAQTGTGKTAAFALPILHRLMTPATPRGGRGPSKRHPRALVLSPTRELAVQIDESFRAYGRHAGLSSAAVYGGVSQGSQVRALQRGVDILVATPGRLLDLMQQRLVDLAKVEVFVLDEADRMLDMGFIDPVRRIAAALTGRRQTLLFSATMPAAITALADSLLRSPVKVAVNPVASTAPRIRQSVFMVGRAQKPALLKHLLERDEVARALVFTRTKHGADRLSRRLHAAGIAADAIHGDKSQNARQRALKSFRDGHARVLVATDVAARGIDVDGITHVFNFDLPDEPEAYVHRIGRTARAGAAGVAIAFCDESERSALRDIERLTGQKIEAVTALPPLPRDDQGAGHGAPASRQRVPGQSGMPRSRRSRRDQAAAPHRGSRGSGEGRARGNALASERAPRSISDWGQSPAKPDHTGWSRKPRTRR